MKIEEIVRERIKGAKKWIIMGVGSELKADDSAGMILAKNLKKALGDKYPEVLVLAGSTAPENLTGEIRKFKPDHLFLVDAAHIEEEPGTIGLIEKEDIKGISFSTHMLPFSIIINYIEQEMSCPVTTFGIQPACLELATEATPAIVEAVKSIEEAFVKVVKEEYGER